MKVCIFPNNSIISDYNNDEIVNKIFNPENIFEEVHIISFIDKEIPEEKVQKIAGNAKLKIYAVGKFQNNEIKNSYKIIKDLVRTISPKIIRAYNTNREGWVASNCAKELDIPFFLSLHSRLDYNIKMAKKTNLKKFINLVVQTKFNESEIFKKAKKISISNKIIEPYLLKKCKLKPELLYNRIDCKLFSESRPIKKNLKPCVLTVGKLIQEKNHECVIRAMNGLDAHCLIIGKGPDFNRLQKIIKKEGLENKIQIIDSVPHNKIQRYYKSATIFASAYDPELEGLPIPVMEAMASGLPIVIPFQNEEFSDGLENTVLFSERNSHEFHNNIKKLLNNQKISQKLSINSINKSKDFDEKTIEKQEAIMYKELLEK